MAAVPCALLAQGDGERARARVERRLKRDQREEIARAPLERRGGRQVRHLRHERTHPPLAREEHEGRHAGVHEDEEHEREPILELTLSDAVHVRPGQKNEARAIVPPPARSSLPRTVLLLPEESSKQNVSRTNRDDDECGILENTRR